MKRMTGRSQKDRDKYDAGLQPGWKSEEPEIRRSIFVDDDSGRVIL